MFHTARKQGKEDTFQHLHDLATGRKSAAVRPDRRDSPGQAAQPPGAAKPDKGGSDSQVRGGRC